MKNFDKLTKLLIHAGLNSPYYADKISINQDTPPEAIESYLNSIPILNKRDVRQKKHRMLSSIADLSEIKRLQTTGTTGEPLDIFVDKSFINNENLLFGKHITRCLRNSDWTSKITYYLQLHASATSNCMPAIWNPNSYVVKWNLARAWQATDNHFLEYLDRINDCVVTTMPSVADLLCRRITEAKAIGRIKPLLVICSGESLSEKVRDKIQSAFQCPVTSLYTMTESGIAAFEIENGLYDVESDSVFLEILDENAKRVNPGVEGNIIVTVLNNFIMPLIRYQTGDRGSWTDNGLLRISEGRIPYHLITTSGGTVNSVRFAKILASLNVEKYAFSQDESGAITFSYFSTDNQLDSMSCNVIQAAILGSIGPGMKVIFKRLTEPEKVSEYDNRKVSLNQISVKSAEQIGPNIEEVSSWLKSVLSNEPQIFSAVLTGSFLDLTGSTRYSDIDLVIFVEGNPIATRWLMLTKKLKKRIPSISVHIDTQKDLHKRSPMLACRLLREHSQVIGYPIEDVVLLPDTKLIKEQGVYRSQEVLGLLQLQLANVEQDRLNPIREAWITRKFLIDIFRYRYILQGEQETSLSYIVQKMQNDPIINIQELKCIDNMHQTACEYIPPLSDYEQISSWYYVALKLIKDVQCEIMNN